jgi:hypothetical protein
VNVDQSLSLDHRFPVFKMEMMVVMMLYGKSELQCDFETQLGV